jgi:hypothetical protein
LSYRKKVLVLIAITTVVKIFIACSINLGNDEVYYRMYAQDMQWNYFDHPPMVAWLIRLTTFNLYFDNIFFIRLGAIICSAIVTWLFYLCGKKLSNEETGYYAACIYTTTIYGSIVAGIFILPDSPQMVCWLICLYLFIKITQYTHINRTKKMHMLYFGIAAGVGMLCKVHSIFLWVAVVLYVLVYNKVWLKEPFFYLAMLATGLFMFPILIWNIDNNFVTYLYHSKRVDVTSGGIQLNNFISFTTAQLLYCNPIIIFFIAKSTVAAIKNNLPVLTSHSKILLLSSLPLMFTALGLSLFKEVLPHWIGPAYCGLILLTASYFSKKTKEKNYKWGLPIPVLASLLLVLAISIIGVIGINFYPGTLGSKSNNNYGDGDFTLDMYGWNSVKKEVEKIIEKDITTQSMSSDAAVVSNKWFPASHIYFYIAMPLKRSLIAIGDTNDIHQYAWLNNKRRTLKQGDDAYFIVPSNNNCDVAALMQIKFTVIQQLDTIIQNRSGKMCRKFYLWRLKNYKEY